MMMLCCVAIRMDPPIQGLKQRDVDIIASSSINELGYFLMSWILSVNKRDEFCVNNGYKDNIEKRERKSLGVNEKMIGWGIITNYKDVGNHDKGAMVHFLQVLMVLQSLS